MYVYVIICFHAGTFVCIYRWVIFTCFISSGDLYTRNGSSPYPTGAAATKRRRWTLYERRASAATESKVSKYNYCVEVTASSVFRGFWGGRDDTGRVSYITIALPHTQTYTHAGDDGWWMAIGRPCSWVVACTVAVVVVAVVVVEVVVVVALYTVVCGCACVCVYLMCIYECATLWMDTRMRTCVLLTDLRASSSRPLPGDDA